MKTAFLALTAAMSLAAAAPALAQPGTPDRLDRNERAVVHRDDRMEHMEKLGERRMDRREDRMHRRWEHRHRHGHPVRVCRTERRHHHMVRICHTEWRGR